MHAWIDDVRPFEDLVRTYVIDNRVYLMAWSSAKKGSMVIGPLLLQQQCSVDRHLHLESIVLEGQPADKVLELLVLFVQAPKLGFCQCQLVI